MHTRHAALVLGPVLALALLALLTLRGGLPAIAAGPGAGAQTTTGTPDQMTTVPVQVFNAQGRLVGPVQSPRVVKTDAEWRAMLTPEQYRITRDSGTERAFCGTLLDNKLEGVYACVCCRLPLFASNAKFDSGTGWPSFFQPVARENVTEKVDRSYGMVRTEINCARCDAHLGHVFDDGPRPTGLRFCLNSEALTFTEIDDLASLADPAAGVLATPAANAPNADPAAPAPGLAEAVFAGGCFWCTEAVFQELRGVKEVISGYAGGTAETANYKAITTGRTAHAEVIRIIYDPAVIDYKTLLKVHFETHDPTTLNRQGADVGPQYRSAIFYASDAEKQAAADYIKSLNDAKAFENPIVTTLEPLNGFWPAEDYHQDFADKNPDHGYIRAVSDPKVEKVRTKFRDRLKDADPAPQR